MSRRIAAPVAFALSLVLGGARPAHAGPVTDLQVLRTWTLDHCYTKNWLGSFPYFTTSSTACVDGMVNFGYSPSLAAYGFTYSFTETTPSPAPPAGSGLAIQMNCLNFSEVPFSAGICPPDAYGYDLGSGQFFEAPSAYWQFDANATLLNGVAGHQWIDATAPQQVCAPDCSEFDESEVVQPVLVTPEPSTIALLASGIGLFGVLSRRRRARRLGSTQAQTYCVSDFVTSTRA